jgi:hypothetical protein
MKQINPHHRHRKASSAREGQEWVLIGEVGRRSGVSPETLRFYGHVGRPDAGYRQFDDTVIERLAVSAPTGARWPKR